MTTNPAIEGLHRDEVMALMSGRVQQKLLLVGADEVAHWSTGLLSQLVQEGWLRPSDNAKEIACDGCHDGHVEEVQYVDVTPDETRAYIVCPINGFTWVAEERLRQWEINALRFVAQMNAAKSAEPKSAPTPIRAPSRDPASVTFAKCWSREDGTFCFATWTNQNPDGMVEFASDRGRMTNQARLIQVLCSIWPDAISAMELLKQVYREDGKVVVNNPLECERHLGNFVTLVSDVKNKKLKRAGLNPDIIPSITAHRLLFESLQLRVKKLLWTDDPDWNVKKTQGRPGWENEVRSIDKDLQELQESEDF